MTTTPFRFAIAATFTAEPLAPVISFWGRELRSEFESRFAPFNQVLQSLLDPTSELSLNNHGINAVFLRLEDLGTSEILEENVHRVADELRVAAARLSVPLVVMLCPSSDTVQPQVTSRMECLLESALEDTPGAQFISHHAIDQWYPVTNPHSPQGEKLGGVPYSEDWYCALGTMLVRQTHALFRPPFKLIALDCDNTLWQGICGEDGPENVRLDAPRRHLHDFMLGQREDGLLLTMASKNNQEDVLETFRAHPEMPLQLRHFVTWRMNWETKASNLSSIAEQLGLGTDSFIFIDDNPKECAELQEALPEVLTLALPEDVSLLPHFLSHVWAFDNPVVTEEDRKRSAYYAQAAEFGNEIRSAGSLEDFMASLNLQVTVAPLEARYLARVAQLTQRTNQFNTTTVRRNEAEIQSMTESGSEVLTAEVSDRFGDYGLVGVTIARPDAGDMLVDTMLLSCRALGRGVEHQMLAAVGVRAAQQGFTHVRLPVRRTARNLPALQFVLSLKFGERLEAADADVVLRLPADELAQLQWQPATETPVAAEKPARKATVTARAIDYGRIANELSTVGRILEAMRGTSVVSLDPSMSDTERQVALIWANLLEIPSPARSDNFFDIGGHSLMAVLLLMRIRETFGVELSIDDVYSGSLTLANLAEQIESARTGSMDPEEYASLLAEIEQMSEDEARELLASESSHA